MTLAMNYLIKGAVFALLFTAMFFVVRSIRRFDPLKKLQEQMEDWERQRLLEQGKSHTGWLERLLDKLDRNLTQAGIKKYVPKGTAEVFFLSCVAEFVLVFWCLGEGILVPFMAGVAAVYVNILLIDILRFKNRRVTENHLLSMLGSISDLALTENEITMILYQTGQRMPYPLKDALVHCHLTARNTGDTGKAFYELRRSIDHPLFREIVLLLELASRNDGNYQKVVDGCRGMVHRYLKEEKEKMAVVRNLLIEAGIMTLIAIYGISTMVHGFAVDAGVTGGFREFFFQNPAGQVCLLIYGLLFFGMIQTIFKFAKR